MARDSRQLSRSRPSPTYLAFQLGQRLAPGTPRPLGYRLADAAGNLLWLSNRSARRAVHWNLGHVLGRTPSPAVVRAVFRHGARNYYDTFIIPTLSRSDLVALVRVASWAPLDEALSRGRGAIMVGGHISSVALAGQVIAAAGYPITSVAERVEPPELDALLHRLRSAGGTRMLPLARDTSRALLAALGRNEIVGLVSDRDLAGTGVEVPFFGANTLLPGGPAVLAIRSGAPILSAVAYRTADERFRGEIGDAIPVERSGSLRECVAATTRRVAQRLERLIAVHPEQWTVFQPIWPVTDGVKGEGLRVKGDEPV